MVHLYQSQIRSSSLFHGLYGYSVSSSKPLSHVKRSASGKILYPCNSRSIPLGCESGQQYQPFRQHKILQHCHRCNMTSMSASMASAASLPPFSHVLETCLYVRNMSESVKFYCETFGIEPFAESVSKNFFKIFTGALSTG